MDRIDIPAGSWELGRLNLRFRARPRELDPERLVSEAPTEAGRQAGLSGTVPSALISTERRVAALVIGGPPARSRRLRRIDTLVDAALEQLEGARRQFAGKMRGAPAAFAGGWQG